MNSFRCRGGIIFIFVSRAPTSRPYRQGALNECLLKIQLEGFPTEKAVEAGGSVKKYSVASHQTLIGQRELVKRMWREAQAWLRDQFLTGRADVAGKTGVEGKFPVKK